MNKCRISFYLCIYFAIPVVTVQSQSIAQYIFSSITITVPAPVSVDIDPLLTVTDYALTPGDFSGKIITGSPFRVKNGYEFTYRLFLCDAAISAAENVGTRKSFVKGLVFSVAKINSSP